MNISFDLFTQKKLKRNGGTFGDRRVVFHNDDEAVAHVFLNVVQVHMDWPT